MALLLFVVITAAGIPRCGELMRGRYEQHEPNRIAQRE
jgi:hypothetical protein